MAKLEDANRRGTRAAQPAATAVGVGVLYGVSDESNILERSNGTAWQAYSPAAGGGGTTVTNYVIMAAEDGEPGEMGPPGPATGGSSANGGIVRFGFGTGTGLDPVDATTYLLGDALGFIPATTNNLPVTMPKGGVFKTVYGRFAITGTLGTAGQNSTFTLHNRTAVTSQEISNAVSMSVNPTLFNNTAMSLAFSAGDVIEIAWLTPTWTTNPLDVYALIYCYVEFS